ncbi:MAG: MarR family transcriptional regulator [Anaerolineae bacterium]|nr:MAG: MarR family transcriptional regulator [Anaerolineae bacterium]
MSQNNRIAVAPDFETRYPGASALATECAMNLVFTADRLVEHIAHITGQYGLSPSAGLVLSILADSDAPQAPSAIADRLIISRASTTSLLDSLEKRGLVTRKAHPTDRRKVSVTITKEGRALTLKFRPEIHRQQNEWFRSLNASSKKSLIAVLHDLQDSLSASEQESNDG